MTAAPAVVPSGGDLPGLPHACDPVPAGDVPGTPSSTDQSVRSTPRLVGIDAARGIALVGMIAVHVFEATDADGTASLAWTLSAGKAAALFALLAGVGIAFASGGRRRRPTGRTWTAQAAALLVRALIIGAVGLALGHLVPTDSAGVILPYYAVLFVLAVPLLSLSSRALVALATVVVLAVPGLSHLLRAGTEPVVVPNMTVTDLVDHPLQALVELTVTGQYPALAWLAYLCVGLAVGRVALSSRAVVGAVILVGTALVVVSLTVSWLLLDVVGGRSRLEQVALQSMTAQEYADVTTSGWNGTTPTDTGWWLATMAPHSSTSLDLAHTIGVALVVLGACILLGRMTTTLLRPLAAAGSMTLTLYCMHLVMLSAPAVPGGPIGFLVQVALLVAFALLWSRDHARGPFEELVAEAAGAVRRRVLAAPTTGHRGAHRKG
ncbi:heparan-alpha-glucosaminide N-acetyltransferase domain-containing protein [Modestobacter sp. VKM Ac-2983]|uniref:acyltransferase family protein n=1 Tax=Modestobacter sp. VKM Ac-2983 TaxID=3004137 RepID=UPI0022ABBE49|nr:acyltransferase family protein [Modestobacter sp. VKM Ac-2983]MCZ2805586.1 heparan-alpha-glucosaminide N-acetyltransferase domain-containing protein [Modestobacter sp. VKM Ac-2983]